MSHPVFAFALFTLLTGLGISSAAANDRLDDVAILTDKKVNVWRRLYAERDANGLD